MIMTQRQMAAGQLMLGSTWPSINGLLWRIRINLASNPLDHCWVEVDRPALPAAVLGLGKGWQPALEPVGGVGVGVGYQTAVSPGQTSAQ